MAKATRWLFSGNPQNQPSRDSAKPVAIPLVSSADAKKFGLENFGNTCYANSVIQALYFCAPFRDLLIQSPDSSLPLAVVETASIVASPTPPPPSATVRRKPERKISSSGTPGDVLPLPSITNNGGTPIPTSPPSLFSALRSLFLHISTNPSDKGTVAPRAFIEKLREVNELFRSTMHQDAHEFFNYLLNKVVEEIEEDRKHIHADPPSLDDLSASIATLASKAAPTVVTTASTNSGNAPKVLTLVHKLFEGTLTSETRCLTCETVSSRDESFLDLSIDIEQNSSVTACLRQFSASETLCQKNKFFCDCCCDLQEAERRMKIKKLPNILALHLKRFKYQEDSRKYIKLAYRVAFPFQLRLFNTVDDSEDADRLYNLFAIVVHIGNGPHHGHYISIIKTMGTWLVFDDDTVSTIAESEIPKYYGESNAGSAYVLYYEAADLDPSSLGLRTPVTMSTASVVPTTESVVAPASPQAVHSILSPGLEEGDSSDLSDPPFPITPSSSSPLLAPESSDKPSRPSLKLDLAAPITDGSTSVPSSAASNAAAPSNGRSKKLFTSMRRPSMRSETADGPEANQLSAVEDKVPTPSIDASLETSSVTSHGQVNGSGSRSPSPHPASVPPRETKEKEKEKEPHRKPSGWFKRRSLRRPSTSHESSAGHKHEDTSTNHTSSASSNVSSSAWYKSATSNGKRMRKQSDFSMFDAAGFAMTSATKSNADGLAVVTSRDRRRSQHDYSDTPPSATSSIHSTNYPASAPTNTNHTRTLEHPPPRKSSLASVPPPIDTFIAAPLPTLPQSPQALSKQPKSPDRKLSLSHLTGRRGHHKGLTEIARPATATGTISDSSSKPQPLPPVPPLPASLGPVSPLANGHVRSPITQDRIKEPIPRPMSASGQMLPPPGLHTFSGKNNSTGSTVSPINTASYGGTGGAATIKRTPRKLSISSPILGGFGFGKKDKEKKEKEKPPSSFAFHPS